jgi:putative membrane-bound dehydrogenase-like protein
VIQFAHAEVCLMSSWKSAAIAVGIIAAATLSGRALTQPPAQPRRSPAAAAVQPRALKVLMLGQDQGQHPATPVYSPLAAPLARHGIQITAVLTPADALVPSRLNLYDALLIYGDQTAMTPEQDKALLEFGDGGKGPIAIHSAAAMFKGSEKYVALIGGQVLQRGTGEVSATIVTPDHPIVQGLQPFQTTDETYAFTRYEPDDRTILMERADGARREPLTWVRNQGKGRVFYTAYGHDARTWASDGFRRLIENAVRWAVDDRARASWEALRMPELSYVDGFNVPNYENRDPPPQYQLPLTPKDSMRFIQTPAEFEVHLFASEPDIVKPIFFTFDERGRVWAIESLDYPNRVLGGAPGNDRIKILEDTNGDGRADKFTVFADHLNIATSLAFADGGGIVTQAPEILFLKDTDGAGKADVRKVLSTGWGNRDTHAQPSNLQYGPDNHIWGVVGYSGFEGEMNGKRMRFDQGVYRVKPDGSDFEFVTGSANNTWGLGLSETFDVFGSTANHDQSFFVAIPDRYFDGIDWLPSTVSGVRASGPGYQSAAAFYAVHYVTPYIRQVDVHGGYTAASGHQLYTARAFPREYWNRIAFIAEPTAHLVGQAVVEDRGAGFVTRDGWNLLAGSEEWVAPIEAQVGPDGAVWVSDWYNFIAQHNPTPPGYSNGKGNAYETSMRDRFRGRIYRVTYRNAPPSRRRALSVNEPAGLVDALSADNMFWRLQAQRLLVERGRKDVVPQLIALTRNTSVDAIGTNGGALHALWTLHGLDEIARSDGPAYRAAVDALKHPAAGVRKAAAMVLPHSPEAAHAIITAGLLHDPDLHTRLAAVLAIADMPPSAEVSKAVYDESRRPENYGGPWLSRAFYIAATRQKDAFLTLYRDDPSAVPARDLPVALRIGPLKPDWRVPRPAELTSAWKDMQVPGNWESRGLPDFDGVVWFTRTFDIQPGNGDSTLSLGRLGNTAEVWVNGLSASFDAGSGRGGGRGLVLPTYTVPAGSLRPGENTITVRIQNGRNDGGFLGPPDAMFVESGGMRAPLAGVWKYRVERQTNAGALYAKEGELAAHVAFVASGGASADSSLPVIAPRAPDIVLRLAVVPGQMKFDRTDLRVTAGQLVEIVFTNPDQMQHNFLLGAPGSLEQIGAAADALAQSPGAAAQSYIPEIPQVVASTRLVDPGQTATIQFRAPMEAGAYPYVCTFPGHWRVMNGTLTVAPGRQ